MTTVDRVAEHNGYQMKAICIDPNCKKSSKFVTKKNESLFIFRPSVGNALMICSSEGLHTKNCESAVDECAELQTYLMLPFSSYLLYNLEIQKQFFT